MNALVDARCIVLGLLSPRFAIWESGLHIRPDRLRPEHQGRRAGS